MTEPVESLTPRSGWAADAADTLEQLEAELDELVVRGLATCVADDFRMLEHAAQALARAGAGHVAGRIEDLVARQRSADRAAARSFLELRTTLRVFERVLTCDVVSRALGAVDAQTPPLVPSSSALQISESEVKKLLPALEEMMLAVEGIVGSGLVAASAATRAKLDLCFKEAARLKVGRLAAALRYSIEEIQRYLDGAPSFSGKRLALFLTRSWIIGRGLQAAVAQGDQTALARLLGTPKTEPANKLKVGTVGVRKRVPQGTGVVAFDFHLRLLEASSGLETGTPLVWSHVIPRKNAELPADALLHLDVRPDPASSTSFKPIALTQGNEVTFAAVQLARDVSGGARLTLTPKSQIAVGTRNEAWDLGSSAFDPVRIAQRVSAHSPSPLDLEVELFEEVVLQGAQVGASFERAQSEVHPVSSQGFHFEVVLPLTEETAELRTVLRSFHKKPPSAPLFGILHFDHCRMIFQPLSLITPEGPRHLMLSGSKVDLKQLTKSLF